MISMQSTTWIPKLLSKPRTVLGLIYYCSLETCLILPPIQAPHVMHKHSNKAYILGVGEGFFHWSSTQEAIAERPELFQLDNPQKRDTFVTNGPTGPTWMIVRYQVVNPGPFLFHCHIETHMANGMAVALLDGIDQWPQVPAGEDQSPGAAENPAPSQSVPPSSSSSSVPPTPTPSSSQPASSSPPASTPISSRPPTPRPSSARPTTSSPGGYPSQPSSSPSPVYSSPPYSFASSPASSRPSTPGVYTPSPTPNPAQPTPPGYSSLYIEPPSPSWLRKHKALMEKFLPSQDNQEE